MVIEIRAKARRLNTRLALLASLSSCTNRLRCRRLKVIVSPVKGLTPLRALRAGFSFVSQFSDKRLFSYVFQLCRYTLVK